MNPKNWGIYPDTRVEKEKLRYITGNSSLQTAYIDNIWSEVFGNPAHNLVCNDNPKINDRDLGVDDHDFYFADIKLHIPLQLWGYYNISILGFQHLIILSNAIRSSSL